MKLVLTLLLAVSLASCAHSETPGAPEYAGDTLRLMERDYGPLILPPDAPPEHLDRWYACSEQAQGDARSALRFAAAWGSRSGSLYVWNTMDSGGEGLRCLDALLATMGARITSTRPSEAKHDRELPWEGAGFDWYIETDQPFGYHVEYDLPDPQIGRPTVWGLQLPPPPGTPWYLVGAPSIVPIDGADRIEQFKALARAARVGAQRPSDSLPFYP